MSYQKKITKSTPSRVNIAYEVEKGDAREKIQLPFVVLMTGDYQGREDKTKLVEREIHNVNKHNFEQTLASMNLHLDLTVKDKLPGDRETMEVNLDFDSMKSFHPEEVARQVPVLDQMLTARRLLDDLRKRVVKKADFRKQLEAIVQDENALEQLGGLVDALITLGQEEQAQPADADG